MAEVVLNQDNFKAEVLDHKGVVLVDFWAVWCGPCKMLSPAVSAIAEKHPEIKVGKVNVDENMGLAEAFRISSIPTLIVFKDGQMLRQSIGLISEREIESLIA